MKKYVITTLPRGENGEIFRFFRFPLVFRGNGTRNMRGKTNFSCEKARGENKLNLEEWCYGEVKKAFAGSGSFAHGGNKRRDGRDDALRIGGGGRNGERGKPSREVRVQGYGEYRQRFHGKIRFNVPQRMEGGRYGPLAQRIYGNRGRRHYVQQQIVPCGG